MSCLAHVILLVFESDDVDDSEFDCLLADDVIVTILLHKSLSLNSEGEEIFSTTEIVSLLSNLRLRLVLVIKLSCFLSTTDDEDDEVKSLLRSFDDFVCVSELVSLLILLLPSLLLLRLLFLLDSVFFSACFIPASS